MMTRSGQRMAIAAGILLLGSIIMFCGVAIAALLIIAKSNQSGFRVLLEPYIWHVAGFTLYQALLSTLLSILGGIVLAVSLHRRSMFFGRGLIVRLMLVPMRMPTLVVAFALIGIWGRNGFINDGLFFVGFTQPVNIYGLSGILLAHTFFNIPLTAQVLLQGMEKVPSEYWRVAAGLNMGPVSTFRFIEWPVFRDLIPGIAGLIFILCVTSFTLVLVLGGGPQATTLEVAIYQSLHFEFDPTRAVSLSLLQIGLTALVLGGMSFFRVSSDPGTTYAGHVRRFDGGGYLFQIVDGIVISAMTLFIVLPLLHIFLSGVTANFQTLFSSPLFWRAFVTSFGVAFCSGMLAVSLTGITIISRQAIKVTPKPSTWISLVSYGLVSAPSVILLMPPVVLATGWFLLLPGPAETSMVGPVLVIALNTLMALPFTMQLLEPSYQQHIERTGRLASSLSIYGMDRFLLIDWPGLRSTILRAFSLAMALSLGDLGAVALFGSDGFVTLPWLLYSKLGSYRTTDADGLALIICFICLGLASLGYQREKREQAR